jgi:guanylate kinase
MEPRRGIPVVLSAASGTGKTTLANLLLDADPKLTLSISTTTRAPRGEERDGVDYHFVDDKAFRKMIDRDAFIEHAEVHGNFYGSSAELTEELLAAGKDVLFDIDVQGGNQLKARFPDACLIFILPPGMDVLGDRLRGRGTDPEEVISRRMDNARGEIASGLDTYDYVITNDTLDRAIADVIAIVRAHRLRGLNRAKIRSRLLGETD